MQIHNGYVFVLWTLFYEHIVIMHLTKTSRFERLFITTHADDNINKPVWIWLGQYFDMWQGKTHVNHYWNMGYSLQAEGKMQIAS